MRTLGLPILLLAGMFLIIGASGNFNAYSSERNVSIEVSSNESGYLAFTCGNLTNTIAQNSSGYFSGFNITNNMPNGETVYIMLVPDYSNLPQGLLLNLEGENGGVEVLNGETHNFMGSFTLGQVSPGTYTVPVEMTSEWDGGEASVSLCSLKFLVEEPSLPRIRKVLLSGNTSNIPLKTYQEWVFRITVENPTGESLDLVVKDTIPAEFTVDTSNVNQTSGVYEVEAAGSGGNSHSATKLKWTLTLPAGGSESIDVKIFTRVNHGNQQEFTSCGLYYLNNGAKIEGYGVTSNPLTVTAGTPDCQESGSGN